MILQLKILFQDICRAETNDWDQEVDGELKQRFVEITEVIRHTWTVLVNRYYFTTIDDMNDVESVQLQGFGDASDVAFGSNVYVRVQKKEETHFELVYKQDTCCTTKERNNTLIRIIICFNDHQTYQHNKGSSVTSSYN